MLNRVTLTGADDTISAKSLVALSDRFPFVEWGILVGTRTGPRFPSSVWLRSLADAVADRDFTHPVNLALHACGKVLRSIVESGDLVGTDAYLPQFQRVQLNFHAEPVAEGAHLRIAECFSRLKWLTPIIQLDGVNDHILEEVGESGIQNVQGLIDQSHGAGVLPDSWPIPTEQYEIGFAGGLGPDNVVDQIRKIRDVTLGQRFWIDMETKVRSEGGDAFDLAKCRRVLEICEPLIEKSQVTLPVK